uniref:Uncharacterized protein n=1 Tax=viral metagenome TaxID=1070528 RepID=A0A6M3J3Y1_9ZZZZ
MAEWRKFYLVPGQQAPAGSTGRGLADGGIAWYGDPATFPGDVSFAMMTQEEIDAPAVEEARIAAKAQAFIDNLPSRAAIHTKIDSFAVPENTKTFLHELSDVIYWLARDKED